MFKFDGKKVIVTPTLRKLLLDIANADNYSDEVFVDVEPVYTKAYYKKRYHL